ncbi:MAG: WcaI family glycosyltransferase [Stenotrophobium sp.]
MKILIIGINYAPEQVGVGKFTSEAAEWLAARGHAVSVITAPPHYPHWRIGEGYSAWRYRRENLAGVQVLRCPLWLPRRLTPLWRIVCCVSFALSSFFPLAWALLKNRPDITLVIEPTFFSVPPAWALASLLRIPVWLHVQDFELEAVRGLGYLSGGRLARIAESVEGWLLRRLRRISTLTPQMDLQLERMRVPANRRILFPNWVDCSQIRPLAAASRFRRQLGIAADSVVLLYSGSFGRKHGLEIIIETARLLRERPDLHFVLCGDGIEKDELRSGATGLANISWLPLQDLDLLNELLNLADIHLLPQRAAIADAVLPSKLTGMLASGRPVIATVEPGTALAKIIAGTGIATPPGDARCFADAIIRLAADHGLRKSLGDEARRYAQAILDKTPILENFEAALRDAVADRDNISGAA